MSDETSSYERIQALLRRSDFPAVAEHVSRNETNISSKVIFEAGNHDGSILIHISE